MTGTVSKDATATALAKMHKHFDTLCGSYSRMPDSTPSLDEAALCSQTARDNLKSLQDHYKTSVGTTASNGDASLRFSIALTVAVLRKIFETSTDPKNFCDAAATHFAKHAEPAPRVDGVPVVASGIVEALKAGAGGG